MFLQKIKTEILSMAQMGTNGSVLFVPDPKRTGPFVQERIE